MVQKGVEAPMRDGVTLLADVYRPAGAEPSHVVLPLIERG